MASKTVAIVTAFYPPHMGGVENYVYNLAQQLKRDGFAVVVVTSAANGREGVEDDDGVRVFRMPSVLLLNDRLPLPRKNAEYRAMKKALMEMDLGYVMVNTRFYPISLFGLKLAKAKNVPAMVLEHGSAYLTLNNPIIDAILHLYEHVITHLAKRYHPLFYAVSEKSGKWLATFGIECKGVLSNAVDADALREEASARDFHDELDIPSDCVLVTFTGRILLEKGVVPLARAVQMINGGQEGNVVHVVFAGDGPALDVLGKHASDHVHILGRINRPDLSALLKQSDIFCLPTDYPEGFPTAALEAGACGAGIVISDTGGASELVPSEDYGIVLPDTSAESVANALKRYIDDRDYLQVASSNVEARVETLFNWRKVASQFESIISEE